MLEQVLESANLRLAWKKVLANKGAQGIDGVTVEAFPEQIKDSWPEIRQEILKGTYQPLPVRRVEIPKRNGDKRPLGIPTVLDRLICQAMLQVLQPLFDPYFSQSSHGFRPNHSAHDAVKEVLAVTKEGYTWVVDIDIAKFFDKVNHDLLMERIGRKVKDKRVLNLIGRYLRAGVMIDGKIKPTYEGIPQGSPLSPLLANIVLDDLDKKLESRGHKFVRYADDFVILVKSKRAAQRVMRSIAGYLKQKLKLEVNQEKSRIVKSSQCEYLGFIFKGKRIIWSEKSFANFKYNIRRLTRRSWGVSMKYRLYKMRIYVQGWMNYYGLSQYYRPIPLLDEWIRRRIRMCFLKQWRRAKTQIRNLLKLGAPEREAFIVGLSSKGWWNLSRTFGSQAAMTKEWLTEQGLISVRQLWITYHYGNDQR